MTEFTELKANWLNWWGKGLVLAPVQAREVGRVVKTQARRGAPGELLVGSIAVCAVAFVDVLCWFSVG